MHRSYHKEPKMNLLLKQCDGLFGSAIYHRISQSIGNQKWYNKVNLLRTSIGGTDLRKSKTVLRGIYVKHEINITPQYSWQMD